MTDPESLSQLLQVCARKTEDFVRLLDSKHMVWLMEIEEAARKMFSSDFTAEPELMPKTPSQKRRRKKRTSIVPDENRDPSGRRLSRRRSSASWSTSVRRLSSRHMTKPLETSIIEESEQRPKRVTRAKAQASIVCMPVSEKPLEELPSNMPNDRLLQVKISAEERRSAEVQLLNSVEKNPALETVVPTSAAPPIPFAPPAITASESSAPVTPQKNDRTAAKLKIADSSTPKKAAVNGSIDLTLDSPQPVAQAAKELALELSNYSVTPTGSKSDRRSVRRSIVGRKSTSHRTSLAHQYSLASKRESMTRESVRKSIRRSVSRKKASDISSSSSYKSYQSSIEVVDEEVTVKIKPETTEPVEEASENPRRSLRTRAFNKIAISNLPETEPQQMKTRQSSTAEAVPDGDDQTIRRKSYKRAVDELSDQSSDEQVNSPPRKKTPSPPCPPSKVIKPPPAHLKTFLHTVQKNQLLMMTPGSIGKSLIAKSFIKRNTPLKVDPKEKERQRQEALRKKEEAELVRKQKIEEGKKRKQEELKLRREERLRKVLQARERVEQLEEEKKKKMEQKFAQIDEKSEKVKEDRLAEEKAKKKITAKKQEEVEGRRRQDEEARKLKAKQLEEEERRHQELLQKKRDEEEQERQRKFAETKKITDMRQAELERERQQAAEKEQERLRAEKERERIEKERALQLQRELDRAAQEKEQQRKEAEERKRKEQQERLEQERQERLRKEMEAKKLEAQRLREEQERIAKEKQTAASVPSLNVTVDIQNSPACESYEMTPKSYKAPVVKINADDYGMDLNSDDSTDDESKPRKPIPAWASGNQLGQAMCQQYYHPIDVEKFYGTIDSPKLEDMFYKSKPRYYKRTSSAVWHSPPLNSNRQHLAVGFGLKKY
ncbi:inner centromere protein [Hyla sarda]|uniref:inner centromere protein n=1 Tax=Hyla sarda TaxID=327740 RepID=UPI0024C32838|nr:inner centromere protein [Hyla sarda]XP_056382742.1 inner centromere protein [Hyla sarda]